MGLAYEMRKDAIRAAAAAKRAADERARAAEPTPDVPEPGTIVPNVTNVTGQATNVTPCEGCPGAACGRCAADDARWDEAFALTQDGLSKLAARVRAEIAPPLATEPPAKRRDRLRKRAGGAK